MPSARMTPIFLLDPLPGLFRTPRLSDTLKRFNAHSIGVSTGRDALVCRCMGWEGTERG